MDHPTNIHASPSHRSPTTLPAFEIFYHTHLFLSFGYSFWRVTCFMAQLIFLSFEHNNIHYVPLLFPSGIWTQMQCDSEMGCIPCPSEIIGLSSRTTQVVGLNPFPPKSYNHHAASLLSMIYRINIENQNAWYPIYFFCQCFVGSGLNLKTL